MNYGKPYTNIFSENGEDFVHIQQITKEGHVNTNGLTLSMKEFSYFMLQLNGLEREIIYKNLKDNTGKKKQLKQRSKVQKYKAKQVNESVKSSTIALVYSQVLNEEIASIVISQCLGCMIGSSHNHDICINRGQYIDEYFVSAMHNVDNIEICNILLEQYKITESPSKEELMKNNNWCNSVKDMLKLM